VLVSRIEPHRDAIRVVGVTKLYRRYTGKRTIGTLKSALLSGAGRRALSPDAAIPALLDVTFRVSSGEMVGVIGANGSGKSTLLKLLSGIIRPTEGEVAVEGRLAALLELGAGFHPEISGRENIEINGLLLGLTRREIAARFDAIVRFAELEEFLDAPLKTYSSGMAVRLGFSIAAYSDPDVLLVDEVLAVGDEHFAHRCLEKFAEFERAGKTILVVSHDLNLIAERCARAIWLERGRVAFDGTAAETVARYRDWVARQEAETRLAHTGVSPAAGSGSIAPDRIGSGEASISAVRLLDAAGQPSGSARSGKAAVLEMTFDAKRPLSDFVFGFAISTLAGVKVFGSNTEIDGFRGEELSGFGRVILEIPALDLAPGVYTLDAAVHAQNGAPYDYRRDVLRFEVTGERAVAGVWSPRRQWRFEGGVRWVAVPPGGAPENPAS
jgi:ABC-type polysaccharide/polyol phosphate transport system ATPase subunit